MFDEITLISSLGNTITNLNQWDNDITVQIPIDSLPDTVSKNLSKIEVHFCNPKSDKALNVKPSSTSTYLSVLIPNSLLRESYNIIMYLYYRNDSVGQTLYTIEIPVRKRPQPNDYVYSDDTSLISIVDIANEMQGKLQELNSKINEVNSIVARIPDNLDDFQHKQEWELCQEITIDETNQASSYIFSASSEGKDFEYDAVIIECLNMTGAAGNFGLNLSRNKTYLTPSNLLVNGLLYGNFLNSVPKNVTVYVERIAGTKRWEVEAVQEDPSKAIYDNSRIVSHKKKLATNYNDEILPAESIVRAVNVYFSGSNKATAGTIRVYGRKELV